MKKPGFTFDGAVSSVVIRELMFQKLKAWIRGWRILLGGGVPSGLFLGKNVSLYNLPNIRFGKWVQLEDHVFISALGKKPLTFGNNVRIGAFSRLITSTTLHDVGSHIAIGNNVGIGEFAYLGGAGGLDIGDDCIVGQYFSCHPENHCFDDPTQLIRLQGTTRQGIRIGKNCWIGSKVTILDGVTVGDNCVIAAGAVVTKNMPANSVIGGVPARVIKSTVDGQRLTVDGQRLTVDGQRLTVDGQRLTVDGERPTDNGSHPSTVHRKPSTVHRKPSTVHRKPSTVHRKPSTVSQTNLT